MSVYIYILMSYDLYLSGYVSYKAIDQWERRMIGHVIDVQRVKLVKAPFEHLVIKSPYLWYRRQRSRYMKSDSYVRQLWLTVRKNIALSRVQWETPVIRRTSFPSTVVGDRSWTRDVFMLKIASRWQSVNEWKSTTTATSSEDSRWTTQIASSWDGHC